MAVSTTPTPADLAVRRKAMGISRRQLAALLGINDETILRWEHGHTAMPPYRQAQAEAALEALEVGFRYAALAAAVRGGNGGRP